MAVSQAPNATSIANLGLLVSLVLDKSNLVLDKLNLRVATNFVATLDVQQWWDDLNVDVNVDSLRFLVIAHTLAHTLVIAHTLVGVPWDAVVRRGDCFRHHW